MDASVSRCARSHWTSGAEISAVSLPKAERTPPRIRREPRLEQNSYFARASGLRPAHVDAASRESCADELGAFQKGAPIVRELPASLSALDEPFLGKLGQVLALATDVEARHDALLRTGVAALLQSVEKLPLDSGDVHRRIVSDLV
jgi:hypothetical protein